MVITVPQMWSSPILLSSAHQATAAFSRSLIEVGVDVATGSRGKMQRVRASRLLLILLMQMIPVQVGLCLYVSVDRLIDCSVVGLKII